MGRGLLGGLTSKVYKWRFYRATISTAGRAQSAGKLKVRRLKKDKIEVSERVKCNLGTAYFWLENGTRSTDLNKTATEMIGFEHWQLNLVKTFAGKMKMYRTSLQIYSTSLFTLQQCLLHSSS